MRYSGPPTAAVRWELTSELVAGSTAPSTLEGARRVWCEALEAGWDGIPRWFHGDVAAGNLLLDDEGRLSAVIDFGTCGVGDPSCDLAAAWTLLTDAGRGAFRDSLGVEDGMWRRGKGWALWKALVTCSNTVGVKADRAEFEEARRVVETIVRKAY